MEYKRWAPANRHRFRGDDQPPTRDPGYFRSGWWCPRVVGCAVRSERDGRGRWLSMARHEWSGALCRTTDGSSLRAARAKLSEWCSRVDRAALAAYHTLPTWGRDHHRRFVRVCARRSVGFVSGRLPGTPGHRRLLTGFARYGEIGRGLEICLL